jgi:hypothetical protein
LVADGDPRHRYLTYRLWFDDGHDRSLTLVGSKGVRDDPGFDPWSDT